MPSQVCLILGLKKHKDLSVTDWACKEEKVFEEEIRYVSEWELKDESEQNQRFE